MKNKNLNKQPRDVQCIKRFWGWSPIVIFIIVLLLIVLCVNRCSDSGKLYKFPEHPKFDNEYDAKKLEFQINYLSQRSSSFQQHIELKENAAWAAFALYITGIVLLFNFLTTKIKGRCFLIPFILLITAVSAFAFIHAQYSSIYDTRAGAKAAITLLDQISYEGKSLEHLQSELDNLRGYNLQHEPKFRGEIHPLVILWYFITLDWVKSNGRNLNNTNIQEATMYFIMIFLYIIQVCYLWTRKNE